MKKILFPTDFSDASKNAFIYALKLADAIGAEIITVHVYQLDSPTYQEGFTFLKEIYEFEELSNFENYKSEIPVLRKIAKNNQLGHIKISNVLLQGFLIDEIITLSEKENADFIVMGTKGVTHLSEIFLGTISTRIMDESKIFVLAIPDNCNYEPIKKILFSTKYNIDDIEALQKVEHLSNVLNSHIDCVNVKPVHSVDNEDFIVDFKNVFKDKNVAFHSRLSNDVEGEILNYIQENGINMVAFHVQHKSFFQKLFDISLSKKLVYHSNIPILSIY